eukprot:228559-Pelagomonas_calceolata.AAC.1
MLWRGTKERGALSCAVIMQLSILLSRVRPQGFAYVEFLEPEAVNNAMLLDGTELRGRHIKVRVRNAGCTVVLNDECVLGSGEGVGGLIRMAWTGSKKPSLWLSLSLSWILFFLTLTVSVGVNVENFISRVKLGNTQGCGGAPFSAERYGVAARSLWIDGLP